MNRCRAIIRGVCAGNASRAQGELRLNSLPVGATKTRVYLGTYLGELRLITGGRDEEVGERAVRDHLGLAHLGD